MHHFIYPSKDTYISSRPGYANKNFGIDEILQVGTANTIVRALSDTKTYYYTSVVFTNYPVVNFTGNLVGAFKGTVSSTYGTLNGVSMLTASYFSGSINGGLISEYSGLINGTLVGLITGSVDSGLLWVEGFSGQLTGSVGCIDGTVTGYDVRNEQNWISSVSKYVDRSLLYFNLTAVSESISSGNIVNPRFHLKLKASNEYELPIDYKIYALPISQSWKMGNGYFSDGGSGDGVNWQYKDGDGGSPWYFTYTSSLRPPIDFITTPSNASASFKYGGGTWYTGTIASQSFSYEVSDVNMDVTPIVTAWLNGSIPNEGFMIISSDELQSTGSGFTLKFFSKDTNTIYSPYLDVMWHGNSLTGDQNDFVTGSISTGSVTIQTSSVGINTIVNSGSVFSISGGISGIFSGSTYLVTTTGNDTYISMSGVVDGKGLSGNIIGVPVVGAYSGIMTSTQQAVTGPCGNNFSASFISASFTTGMFSGSNFGAYYVDGKLENAFLTGSWTETALLGTYVNIPLPSNIAPYAYAYVSGAYLSGVAFGIYSIFDNTSASFFGQFTKGPYLGGYLNVQLTGSALTSSYSYTSSVSFESVSLDPLNVLNPFTVIVKDIRPIYKSGDIIKLGVFGRRQFPLKQFGISSQLEQYIVPEYLPSSSYYALKDNETGEIVLGFDNYTSIGCSYPSGNYFVIDTTGLPQERYYRVLIRIEDNGTIYTTDCGKIFKITR